MLALVLMNHMTNKKKSILIIVDEKQEKGFNLISFMQEMEQTGQATEEME